MKACLLVIVLAVAGSAAAQAPAGAPAGATGICRDGTYSTAASKSGACQGHKGVQTWYAGTGVVAGKPPAAMPAPTPGGPGQSKPAATPTGAPASPPAAMPAPTPASTASAKGPAAAAAAKTEAPGGGPGLVWVNTASNVYHCPGTTYYGKTKDGTYMTETEAKAKGAHGVRGATCDKK